MCQLKIATHAADLVGPFEQNQTKRCFRVTTGLKTFISCATPIQPCRTRTETISSRSDLPPPTPPKQKHIPPSQYKHVAHPPAKGGPWKVLNRSAPGRLPATAGRSPIPPPSWRGGDSTRLAPERTARRPSAPGVLRRKKQETWKTIF